MAKVFPYGKPLTLKDFEGLEKGQVIHLYYVDVNRGAFQWKHSHVEGDKVFGAFRYPESEEFSEISDYLYEFDGYVCRGSGAEVCRAGQPPVNSDGSPAYNEHWEGDVDVDDEDEGW